MANQRLATYLNDHLAGSELALGLLEHLEREHKGHPIAGYAAELRLEIGADKGELEALMARLDITQSPPRKLAAWLSEKMAKLKLTLDDPGGGDLRRLEIFEALSLGIEGKHSLWRALEAASDVNMALRSTDYATLKRRAEEQRQGVEAHRLAVAKVAFGSEPVAEKG